MSLFEVFKDTATPQTIKDLADIKKIGDALGKIKKKSEEEVVDEIHGILKKDWLERTEKQLIKVAKGYDRAYRTKMKFPPDETEKYEKYVIKTYKAERAKGIAHEKCNKTKDAIQRMLDYLQAYEKEARAVLEKVRRSIPSVRSYSKEFETKRNAAKYLEKQFRNIAQVVVISPFHGEMVVYSLHCAEIAKQCNICLGTLRKIDKRYLEIRAEYTEIAEISHEQFFYVFGGDLFDDLPNRI